MAQIVNPLPDPERPHGGLYRRLEVGPAASHDEIVRAYRRLARGVHPDAHPEDPEASTRFREITEAYEVLTDPGRREAYDRTRVTRRIPVHRRAPNGPMVEAAGTTRGQTRPTFLGTPRVEPMRGVPLRVGPVRVGAPDGAEVPRSVLADLFFEILDSWWGR